MASAASTLQQDEAQAAGPKLFAHDRSLGARFVAGADEAGRGCLAGPLVAAAVLFDQQRLTRADIKALASLNDSKLQTPGRPRRAIPGDPADRRQGLDRLALRPRHRRARTARDQPRGSPRGAGNVACDGRVCLSDGFAWARSATSTAP